ncbi:fimbria/pilus periplasmic chaperone (plasmid) [Serratia sp. JSRIV001]|uniref:fimbria/pilus periplasmic chaperone n=1 Tax=unclassified Serratia (in: enterobacteria) TaxID=2647522 RepID=UPI001CBFBE43|nr:MULTISPECIES: fimbria/pilus periplasmic chaperone [unclassified Serratia (in: enterobacteria)]UAN45223.1 fimbria/pilus periplasmic chaperone [Serratia sp. JSRIV001]UAN48823.1 fimbria/pilus periplasmic chaperone [Serratia sp. JSRIV001]UAN50697.1 fimbria/pilus periplasmic chaperone [Serratia sp. JSRIV002]UAN54545.1 fimbria/pilus periplasmic chaperone [Serratia sp. JSRIV002]UAN56644.1 fimbria/pilus periplasmic chaperone [Serratia sp. JSRIV004]
MKHNLLRASLAGALMLVLMPSVHAAISLDRTRVVFPGSEKSVSLNVSNQNPSLPYLAQGWIEDANGNKLEGGGPLTLLPPVQRIEPKGKGQIKIQAMPGLSLLPQDKETLFYLNLREIPPKSNKPNTLQIALQTRIKLFYRPAALAQAAAEQQTSPFQNKLTLSKSGDTYTVNNPTPYYITLIGASAKAGGDLLKGFEAMMVPPKGSAPLGGKASDLGNSPALVYVNDYGGQPTLTFRCDGTQCKVDESRRDKK